MAEPPDLPPDASDSPPAESGPPDTSEPSADVPPPAESGPGDEPLEAWVEKEGKRIDRRVVREMTERTRRLADAIETRLRSTNLRPLERTALAEALELLTNELLNAERLQNGLEAAREQATTSATGLVPADDPYAEALLDAHRAASEALAHAERVERDLSEAIELAKAAEQAKRTASSAKAGKPPPDQLRDALDIGADPTRPDDVRLSDEDKRGRFWFDLGIQPQDLLVGVNRQASARGNAEDMEYWPNSPIAGWFAVGYDVWGFDFGRSLGDSDKPKEEYGSTTFTALTAERTFEQTWHRDLNLRTYYQRYRGFYLYNDDILQPGDGTRIREDMEADYVGVAGRYFLNSDFSYLESIKHARRKPVSRGSFYLRNTLEYGRLAGDRPLIIPSQQPNYGAEQTLRGAEWVTLGFGIGYVYDWVLGGFHVSPGLSLGIGPQWQRALLVGESRTGAAVGFAGDLRLAIGYYGDYLRVGFDVAYDASNTNVGKTQVGVQHIWATMFAGGRF